MRDPPFYLVYGRDLVLPTDILAGAPAELTRDLHVYKSAISVNLKQAHEIVRARLSEIAAASKERHDATASNVVFEEGSSVLLFNPKGTHVNPKEPSRKLDCKWSGPYAVESRRFDGVYHLRDPSTSRTWSVNVDRLRAFAAKPLPLSEAVRFDAASTPSSDKAIVAHIAGHDIRPPRRRSKRAQALAAQAAALRVDPSEDPLSSYTIERILSHRGCRTPEYLVKWEGYDDSANLWIPASSFNTWDILVEY